jgi:hypothetical protein
MDDLQLKMAFQDAQDRGITKNQFRKLAVGGGL